MRVPADATAIDRQLLADGVLVKDVSSPGLLERCFRITVGTPRDNERCVRMLHQHLACGTAFRLHCEGNPLLLL